MVSATAIEDLTHRIAEAYRPRRIILFGSHASGRAREDSDVDLLVEMPFEGRGLRKAVEILSRFSPAFPTDVLVRRPEDVARRYAEGDPLIREALDHGKVLYERDDA